MSYNYSKLNGRIVEVCGSQKKFSELMNLSERTISLKLSNKRKFKQDEINNAINVLKLSEADIQSYFFNLQVQ